MFYILIILWVIVLETKNESSSITQKLTTCINYFTKEEKLCSCYYDCDMDSTCHKLAHSCNCSETNFNCTDHFLSITYNSETECFLVPASSPKVCSGHGKCVDSDECECDFMFIDEKCTFFITFYLHENLKNSFWFFVLAFLTMCLISLLFVVYFCVTCGYKDLDKVLEKIEEREKKSTSLHESIFLVDELRSRLDITSDEVLETLTQKLRSLSMKTEAIKHYEEGRALHFVHQSLVHILREVCNFDNTNVLFRLLLQEHIFKIRSRIYEVRLENLQFQLKSFLSYKNKVLSNQPNFSKNEVIESFEISHRIEQISSMISKVKKLRNVLQFAIERVATRIFETRSELELKAKLEGAGSFDEEELDVLEYMSSTCDKKSKGCSDWKNGVRKYLNSRHLGISSLKKYGSTDDKEADVYSKTIILTEKDFLAAITSSQNKWRTLCTQREERLQTECEGTIEKIKSCLESESECRYWCSILLDKTVLPHYLELKEGSKLVFEMKEVLETILSQNSANERIVLDILRLTHFICQIAYFNQKKNLIKMNTEEKRKFVEILFELLYQYEKKEKIVHLLVLINECLLVISDTENFFRRFVNRLNLFEPGPMIDLVIEKINMFQRATTMINRRPFYIRLLGLELMYQLSPIDYTSFIGLKLKNVNLMLFKIEVLSRMCRDLVRDNEEVETYFPEVIVPGEEMRSLKPNKSIKDLMKEFSFEEGPLTLVKKKVERIKQSMESQRKYVRVLEEESEEGQTEEGNRETRVIPKGSIQEGPNLGRPSPPTSSSGRAEEERGSSSKGDDEREKDCVDCDFKFCEDMNKRTMVLCFFDCWNELQSMLVRHSRREVVVKTIIERTSQLGVLIRKNLEWGYLKRYFHTKNNFCSKKKARILSMIDKMENVEDQYYLYEKYLVNIVVKQKFLDLQLPLTKTQYTTFEDRKSGSSKNIRWLYRIIESEKNIVLHANGGAGKSCLLRHLCFYTHFESNGGRSRKRNKKKMSPLFSFFVKGYLLPSRYKEWKNSSFEEKVEILIDLIISSFDDEFVSLFTELELTEFRIQIKHILSSREICLCVDALDEVPVMEREAFLNFLHILRQEELIRFSKMIMTTRPELIDILTRTSWETVPINPLTFSNSRKLVLSILRHNQREEEEEKRIMFRFTKILETPDFQNDGGSPLVSVLLLKRLLSTEESEDAVIAESNFILYESLLQGSLKHDRNKNSEEKSIAECSMFWINNLLSVIAFVNHRMNSPSSTTLLHILNQNFENIVGHEGWLGSLKDPMGNILRTLFNFASCLTENKHVVVFSHRTIQEYYCARFVVNPDDDPHLANIRKKFNQDPKLFFSYYFFDENDEDSFRWKNVYRFIYQGYSSKMSKNGSSRKIYDYLPMDKIIENVSSSIASHEGEFFQQQHVKSKSNMEVYKFCLFSLQKMVSNAEECVVSKKEEEIGRIYVHIWRSLRKHLNLFYFYKFANVIFQSSKVYLFGNTIDYFIDGAQRQVNPNSLLMSSNIMNEKQKQQKKKNSYHYPRYYDNAKIIGTYRKSAVSGGKKKQRYGTGSSDEYLLIFDSNHRLTEINLRTNVSSFRALLQVKDLKLIGPSRLILESQMDKKMFFHRNLNDGSRNIDIAIDDFLRKKKRGVDQEEEGESEESEEEKKKRKEKNISDALENQDDVLFKKLVFEIERQIPKVEYERINSNLVQGKEAGNVEEDLGLPKQLIWELDKSKEENEVIGWSFSQSQKTFIYSLDYTWMKRIKIIKKKKKKNIEEEGEIKISEELLIFPFEIKSTTTSEEHVFTLWELRKDMDYRMNDLEEIKILYSPLQEEEEKVEFGPIILVIHNIMSDHSQQRQGSLEKIIHGKTSELMKKISEQRKKNEEEEEEDSTTTTIVGRNRIIRKRKRRRIRMKGSENTNLIYIPRHHHENELICVILNNQIEVIDFEEEKSLRIEYLPGSIPPTTAASSCSRLINSMSLKYLFYDDSDTMVLWKRNTNTVIFYKFNPHNHEEQEEIRKKEEEKLLLFEEMYEHVFSNQLLEVKYFPCRSVLACLDHTNVLSFFCGKFRMVVRRVAFPPAHHFKDLENPFFDHQIKLILPKITEEEQISDDDDDEEEEDDDDEDDEDEKNYENKLRRNIEMGVSAFFYDEPRRKVVAIPMTREKYENIQFRMKYFLHDPTSSSTTTDSKPEINLETLEFSSLFHIDSYTHFDSEEKDNKKKIVTINDTRKKKKIVEKKKMKMGGILDPNLFDYDSESQVAILVEDEKKIDDFMDEEEADDAHRLPCLATPTTTPTPKSFEDFTFGGEEEGEGEDEEEEEEEEGEGEENKEEYTRNVKSEVTERIKRKFRKRTVSSLKKGRFEQEEDSSTSTITSEEISIEEKSSEKQQQKQEKSRIIVKLFRVDGKFQFHMIHTFKMYRLDNTGDLLCEFPSDENERKKKMRRRYLSIPKHLRIQQVHLLKGHEKDQEQQQQRYFTLFDGYAIYLFTTKNCQLVHQLPLFSTLQPSLLPGLGGLLGRAGKLMSNRTRLGFIEFPSQHLLVVFHVNRIILLHLKTNDEEEEIRKMEILGDLNCEQFIFCSQYFVHFEESGDVFLVGTPRRKNRRGYRMFNNRSNNNTRPKKYLLIHLKIHFENIIADNNKKEEEEEEEDKTIMSIDCLDDEEIDRGVLRFGPSQVLYITKKTQRIKLYDVQKKQFLKLGFIRNVGSKKRWPMIYFNNNNNNQQLEQEEEQREQNISKNWMFSLENDLLFHIYSSSSNNTFMLKKSSGCHYEDSVPHYYFYPGPQRSSLILLKKKERDQEENNGSTTRATASNYYYGLYGMKLDMDLVNCMMDVTNTVLLMNDREEKKEFYNMLLGRENEVKEMKNMLEDKFKILMECNNRNNEGGVELARNINSLLSKLKNKDDDDDEEEEEEESKDDDDNDNDNVQSFMF